MFFEDELRAALVRFCLALVIIERRLGIPAADAQQRRALQLGIEKLVRGRFERAVFSAQFDVQVDQLLSPGVAAYVQMRFTFRCGEDSFQPLRYGPDFARLIDRLKQCAAFFGLLSPETSAVEESSTSPSGA